MQAKPTAGRALVKTSTPGIYKRGNRYVVRLRGPDGRHRKHAARTLAEARDLKAALTADLRRGEYRQYSRVTFADYASTWLASYGGRTGRGTLRETTLREYGRYTAQASAHFGRRRLTEITPPDVKAYAATLMAKGLARNSVRNAVGALRVLLATAVEDGLLRHNPASGVRLPAGPVGSETGEPAAKALTDAELARLLAETPPAWRLLVRFLADTGLRIGEALALQWADVDFGRRRVQVRRRVYAGKYAPPKSSYGRRSVPISPDLAQELWAHRRALHGTTDTLVWPGKGTQPLDASTTYRVVKAAAKAAGVGWAAQHTLRHTAATRLFRAGLNAKQVQVWLGHHSPAFTLASYVHLLPDDLPEAPFLAAPAPAAEAPEDEAVRAVAMAQ